MAYMPPLSASSRSPTSTSEGLSSLGAVVKGPHFLDAMVWGTPLLECRGLGPLLWVDRPL